MKARQARSLRNRISRAGPQTFRAEELVELCGLERFNAHGRSTAVQQLRREGLETMPELTAAETTRETPVALYMSGTPVPPRPAQPVSSSSHGAARSVPQSPAAARNEVAATLANEVRLQRTNQLTLAAILARFSERRMAPTVLRELRETLEAAGVATTPLPDGVGVGPHTRLRLTSIKPRPRPSLTPQKQWPTQQAPAQPKRPTSLLVELGRVRLIADRLVAHDGRVYRIGPDTTAIVESLGNVTATRGRNLAAKAMGGLLVPGGIFLFGNARDRFHDFRELYLTVEDPSWSYTFQCHPDAAVEVRGFAAAVRRAARGMAEYQQRVAAATAVSESAEEQRSNPVPTATPEDVSVTSEIDTLAHLERLADLRDCGALTEEEFARQKAQLLGDARE